MLSLNITRAPAVRRLGNVPSLDELWESAPSSGARFLPGRVAGLPEASRRYLQHAIAAGTPLATAVRLRMHGEIKLRRWLPFTAEQVISWTRGMIWRATVRLHGMPIGGFDRLVDGEGAMRWRLLGIVPLVTASGPDISRSAAGRVGAEAVWLPSAFCGEGVWWTSRDPTHAKARFTLQGHALALNSVTDAAGRVTTVQLQRWGNPEGGAFRACDFGGVAEDEQTFGGYTIPTRLRVGWYVGSPQFESTGEFFRVTVDDATYR